MVYVSSVRACIPNRKWRWPQNAYLFADSDEELHAFASRLGLKRSWFQAKSTFPHYDLTASKQFKAMQLGAELVTDRFIGRRIKKARLEAWKKRQRRLSS